MKLTYWYCQHLADSDVYSIRTKTRREAVALRAEIPADYSEPVKVSVEYDNAFDLMQLCSEEDNHWWEAIALRKASQATS